MARQCFVASLFAFGLLVHIYGGDVDKRLLDSDPNYLHNIEVKMQDMTQTIADLTQKYADVAHNNSVLTKKYTDMSHKYEDLTQKYDELKHENGNLSHKYADVFAQLNKQNMTIEAMQASKGNQRRIYFDAYPSKTVRNLGSGQTIVFDSIRSNVGNRYNPTTGQFVCDTPGVYVFYYRLLVTGGVTLYTWIMKNGTDIENMLTYDTGSFGHSATLIIHQLQTGDIVWVETNPNHPPLTGDVLNNYDTTFAGFLLYPDN